MFSQWMETASAGRHLSFSVDERFQLHRGTFEMHFRHPPAFHPSFPSTTESSSLETTSRCISDSLEHLSKSVRDRGPLETSPFPIPPPPWRPYRRWNSASVGRVLPLMILRKLIETRNSQSQKLLEGSRIVTVLSVVQAWIARLSDMKMNFVILLFVFLLFLSFRFIFHSFLH